MAKLSAEQKAQKARERKQKREQAKNARQRLNVPVVAISDNVVFTKKEVWAYYKISTVPYVFLSNEAKADLAESTISSLAAINQSAGKKIDGQILITNTPFDVMSWANQVDQAYLDRHMNEEIPAPYNRFMNEQFDQLNNAQFQRPVVYLGIKLFNRSSLNIDSFNVLEFGFHDAYKLIKESISQMFVLPSEKIDKYEEDRAKAQEKELFTTISTGNLHPKKVSANELLLTMKRRFYPAMPVPYLEIDHGNRFGTSDILMETGGVLKNNYRYLELNQNIDGHEYSGFRATLSFARFPKMLTEPSPHYPFFYEPAAEGLPYTLNTRFTMIPSQNVKKDLQKKKLETDDELKNLAMSEQGSNSQIESTMEDLSELENNLEDNKRPWLSGSYRITVEAPTLDSLKEQVSAIKQTYAEEEITVIWTAGDQLPLLLEEMPGGELASTSFNQMTDLSMLGVSGFNLGGTVGDPVNEKMILTERGLKNNGKE